MTVRLGLVIALVSAVALWAPAAMAQTGSVGTAGAGTLAVKAL